MTKRLSLESADGFEDAADFSITEDRQLCVKVGARTVHLSRAQTRRLRDWLNIMIEKERRLMTYGPPVMKRS